MAQVRHLVTLVCRQRSKMRPERRRNGPKFERRRHWSWGMRGESGRCRRGASALGNCYQVSAGDRAGCSDLRVDRGPVQPAPRPRQPGRPVLSRVRNPSHHRSHRGKIKQRRPSGNPGQAPLARGHWWVWGATVWAAGGAVSVGRYGQTEGVSSFRDEALTDAEVDQIIADGPADVVIAHDAPWERAPCAAFRSRPASVRSRVLVARRPLAGPGPEHASSPCN